MNYYDQFDTEYKQWRDCYTEVTSNLNMNTLKYYYNDLINNKKKFLKENKIKLSYLLEHKYVEKYLYYYYLEYANKINKENFLTIIDELYINTRKIKKLVRSGYNPKSYKFKKNYNYDFILKLIGLGFNPWSLQPLYSQGAPIVFFMSKSVFLSIIQNCFDNKINISLIKTILGTISNDNFWNYFKKYGELFDYSILHTRAISKLKYICDLANIFSNHGVSNYDFFQNFKRYGLVSKFPGQIFNNIVMTKAYITLANKINTYSHKKVAILDNFWLKSLVEKLIEDHSEYLDPYYSYDYDFSILYLVMTYIEEPIKVSTFSLLKKMKKMDNIERNESDKLLNFANLNNMLETFNPSQWKNSLCRVIKFGTNDRVEILQRM